MTLTNARATIELLARATPAGTNISGPITLGQSVPATFSDADICYSLKVVGGYGTITEHNFKTHAHSVGSGSATLTDAAGNDFEGTNIPDLVTLYAILLTTPTEIGGDDPFNGNPIVITDTITNFFNDDLNLEPGQTTIFLYRDGFTPANAIWNLTFGGSDAVTITVLGKSS